MGVAKFLNLPGQHSIFYYGLLVILAGVAIQAVGIGSLYFFKRSGEKRANALYGLLLLSFGCTMSHYIMMMTGLTARYPVLSFLPIYFTLSFPPLLFFHIKFNLYPLYRFRLTDTKHLLLPVGQFVYFLWALIVAPTFTSPLSRQFYNPFYGAMETALYLFTFFAYLFFGYRYIVQKRTQIRNSRDAQLVRYLGRLVQILFILFATHTAFVLTDFVSYEFLQINLRAVKLYAALGMLSFAALVLWSSIYGLQVLIWGRKVLK